MPRNDRLTESLRRAWKTTTKHDWNDYSALEILIFWAKSMCSTGKSLGLLVFIFKKVISLLQLFTAWNTVISPTFLVWKFSRKARSFHRVSGDSLETPRKLCLSGKSSHQKIRWNHGILRCDYLIAMTFQISFTGRLCSSIAPGKKN